MGSIKDIFLGPVKALTGIGEESDAEKAAKEAAEAQKAAAEAASMEAQKAAELEEDVTTRKKKAVQEEFRSQGDISILGVTDQILGI